MNQKAGEVMSRGIQVKQRAIQRVGDPGQRMPVRLLGRRQRPLESVGSQALAHVRIIDDVSVIVIIHKRMAVDRVVERQRDHRQQQADDLVPLPRIRKQACLALGRQYQDLTTEHTEEHRGETRKARGTISDWRF